MSTEAEAAEPLNPFIGGDPFDDSELGEDLGDIYDTEGVDAQPVVDAVEPDTGESVDPDAAEDPVADPSLESGSDPEGDGAGEADPEADPDDNSESNSASDTGNDPESGPDGETEASAEPVVDPDPDAPADDKGPGIPHWRFNQQNQKLKNAQAEVERLKNLQAQPDNPDPEPPEPIKVNIGEAGKEMWDKALDGKFDEANTMLGGLIADAVTQATAGLAEQVSSSVKGDVSGMVKNEVSQDVNVRDLNSTLDLLEEQFPAINPDHTDFDKELHQEIVMLTDGYIQHGYSPADAVSKAADVGIRSYRPELIIVEDPAPVDDSTPEPAKPKIDPKDVARNVTRKKDEPPLIPPSAGGNESTEPDLANMSDEEMEALPEATLKRMRGDYL